jgi:hypothetical protein
VALCFTGKSTFRTVSALEIDKRKNHTPPARQLSAPHKCQKPINEIQNTLQSKIGTIKNQNTSKKYNCGVLIVPYA